MQNGAIFTTWLVPTANGLVQSVFSRILSKTKGKQGVYSVPLPSTTESLSCKTRSLTMMGVDAEGPLSSCTHLTPFLLVERNLDSFLHHLQNHQNLGHANLANQQKAGRKEKCSKANMDNLKHKFILMVV